MDIRELNEMLQHAPRFAVQPQTIYASAKVKLLPGCYGWMAINYGDVVVQVDQVNLPARLGPGLIGGAWGFMDNNRVYNAHDITVVFTAGGIDPRLTIIQIVLA